MTSTVHAPGAGFWINTFSTVSLVFAAPPGVEKLLVPSPLFPQYWVMRSGAVTRSERSLIRETRLATLAIGSMYAIVTFSAGSPGATVSVKVADCPCWRGLFPLTMKVRFRREYRLSRFGMPHPWRARVRFPCVSGYLKAVLTINALLVV